MGKKKLLTSQEHVSYGGPSRIRTNDQGVAVPRLSHLAIGPCSYNYNKNKLYFQVII